MLTSDAAASEEQHVLLIEDDAGDALLVEEMVADCQPPLRLTWARSMAQARTTLIAERPDCVLLDLHLTDSDGLAALAAVERVAEGIPVVVLTGQTGDETGLAAVAAGAQDYLAKGRVDAESLGRSVRYAVQRKQSEQATVALQASQLQAQENARLERGLLPRPLLAPTTDLRVTTRYRPGRAQALLGGDLYDVVETPDGTVEVLIGDVSGHGPDEAAVGVALRIAWRTLVLSGIEGEERLRRLERILEAERSAEHIFVTLSCVSLLPDHERIHVVRAGHPGLLLRAGGTVELAEVPGGPPLGALPEPAWPVTELPMPEGGLMLFTDGLFEGRTSARGDRLGEEGLLEAAQRLADADADAFVDGLIRHAQQLAEPYGGLDDDIAVVHLAWEGR
ncbi:MAG: SpoIIE family protein phosphatase [Nocardioides sp.]|uniref:PP2C family protein-serine/threonine phosphatase n=1 Tax=Nocardioides sp. TaxID=35761 RepID=UPI0039E29953